MLAEDAIKSAIKDYQTKREKRLAAVSNCVCVHRIVLISTGFDAISVCSATPGIPVDHVLV